MRLLLDTQVWLWMLASPARIRVDVRADLERATLFLSTASAWEIAIKHGLGKLPLPEPPESFVPARLLRDGVTALPIELHHALAVSALPPHHADPFDRLLIAQARAERLVLVTADDAIAAYDVEQVRAC